MFTIEEKNELMAKVRDIHAGINLLLEKRAGEGGGSKKEKTPRDKTSEIIMRIMSDGMERTIFTVHRLLGEAGIQIKHSTSVAFTLAKLAQEGKVVKIQRGLYRLAEKKEVA